VAVVQYTFTYKHRTTQFTNLEKCEPCPVLASYTLAFALQLRKKHQKPQSGWRFFIVETLPVCPLLDTVMFRGLRE